jgi:hypothetical protein
VETPNIPCCKCGFHFPMSVSFQNIRLRWRVLSLTPSPQVREPPLVGCPRLLIQYIRICPPCLDALSQHLIVAHAFGLVDVKILVSSELIHCRVLGQFMAVRKECYVLCRCAALGNFKRSVSIHVRFAVNPYTPYQPNNSCNRLNSLSTLVRCMKVSRQGM